MTVCDTIEAYSSQHELLKQGVYLVAISGGRDSVCLLDALLKCGYNKLILCHVNYGLRDEHSDNDESLVRLLAEKNKLECEVKRVQLHSDTGFEAEARTIRYEFFAEIVNKYKALGIFLGHHADDQAETILFNLLRGGAGLKGMKAVSVRGADIGSYMLYRPLITVRRSEINSYIEQQQLKYGEDHTNNLPIATRNRIRNEVLPLLKDVMQREVTSQLNRAYDVSSMHEEFFIQEAIDPQYRDPQGRLFLPKLRKKHRAIQYHVIFKYLSENKIKQINYDLVERAIALMERESGGVINLPGGHSLHRRQQRMFVVMIKES